MKVIYDGIIGSKEDIETLKWILGKAIKEGEIRVIVKLAKEEKK